MNALTKPMSDYHRARLTRRQRWWHETLADFLLMNPTASNQECSDFFNGLRSPDTIQLIRNTDVFKALMASRRQEINENMSAAIISKAAGVTYTAFDAILDKINKKRDTLPMNELTSALETVNKFVNGPVKTGGVTVNVNQPQQTLVVPVGINDLAEAQAALRRHQATMAQAPITIDVVPEPVKEEVVAAAPADSDPAP
jgi:hypothetical protein